MPQHVGGSPGGHSPINGVHGIRQGADGAPSLSQQARPAQQRNATSGVFARGRASSVPAGVHQRGRTHARSTSHSRTQSPSRETADPREQQDTTPSRSQSEPPMSDTHKRMMEAMEQTEKTHLTTMIMQQQFSQQKQVVDTVNSIGADMVDSAKKAQEAMKQMSR